MKVYPVYAGGRFIETGQTLVVRNPYNGEPLASVSLASEKELNLAITEAQAVQEPMKQLPAYQRYNILMEICNGVLNDKTRLAEVLASEAAKPIRLAMSEIDRAAETFRVAAEESKRLPKEYLSLDWTLAGQGKEGWVKYFPLGIVAGISPFNFPMNLAVHKIAPAIAAGCPIILKPSSSTPLSTLELAGIVHNTTLPHGALSVLPMDRVTGNLLVTDPRFKLLTFTGSPEVGWKMKQEAGKKKVVLELGGNAGVIVSESANLPLAIDRCVMGGFSYSGQICIHAQRIFVHEAVFENFAQRFIERVSALRQGHPLDPEADLSSMIDEESAFRVETWVNEAVDHGAKVLTGGRRIGNFYEPTVLTNTVSSMKVCALEIFGPVVTLEPFSDFSKAVYEVNNSRFGLQAGVFSDRLSEMNYAFEYLDVGGVIINDVPTFRVDHMPYGGVKDSGSGREGVRYAIAGMMEPRLLVRNIR